VAYSLAASLTSIWDVSIPTLTDGNFNGMWRLTLLCACIQIVGLFFINLMPSGVVEQLQLLRANKESKLAGVLFLLVVFSSLAYVVIYTIITIIDPALTS
jgi:hypothetical protein